MLFTRGLVYFLLFTKIYFICISEVEVTESFAIEQDFKYEIYKNALLDFIQVENRSTSVRLFIQCWPKRVFRQLMRELWNNNIYSEIQTLSNNKVLGQHLELFVLDLDCPTNPTTLRKANASGLLLFPRRWFVFSVNSQSSKAIPTNLYLPLNTRFYIFDSDLNLSSIYTRINSATYLTNYIGRYHADHGFHSLHILSDFYDRADQHGFQISIPFVWVHNTSLNHLDDFRDQQRDPSSKQCRHMILLLLDIMNATYTATHFNTWGTLAKVKVSKKMIVDTNLTTEEDTYEMKYTAMLGFMQSALDDEQVQMTGTVCFPLPDRIKFLDFIAAPAKTTTSFCFRKPSLSLVNNILIMPFNSVLWVACIMLLVVFYFALTGISRWEDNHSEFYDGDAKMDPTVLKMGGFEVLHMEIGAVCQQGSEATPWSLSGRTTTYILFLSFLFIYTAYSACIVALMQSTSDSIRTLTDLLNTNIELGIEDSNWMKYFFMNQQDPLRSAIYQQKINKPGNFFPVEAGAEKIRKEFFGFHMEDASLYSLISQTFHENEKCGIGQIRYLNDVFPYMALKKNCIFKKIIKPGYERFKEHGLENRYYRRLYAVKPICVNPGANFRSVSIMDCYFALGIYFSGLLIAVVIFLFELLVKRIWIRK